MNAQSKYFRSPWLESVIMVGSVILSFAGLGILSLAVPRQVSSGEMANGAIVLILFGFFMLSVAIAMVSVIAGIGGGVIFTPIMLAFTGVNSVVVRGTGLIVAMFSGLISTGIFIKKRISNYRLCLILTLSQGFGALAGSTLAVSTAQSTGAGGEGLLRASLGFILLAISVYFFLGGKRLEWPAINKVGRFTRWLRLDGYYIEKSMGQVLNYQVTRAPLGILLVFLVGVLGGFFGMGGGWAITPALNLGMGLPLKLAAANSGVILGIGSCVSVWPYAFAGGIIPFFVLPWLSGQVIGGFIGSYVLARIKVQAIRFVLIGIMLFTSFGLVTKGLELLKVMGGTPPLVQVGVFALTTAGTIIAVFAGSRKKERSHEK
ncbi:MAG: sulfite exporter TauE/SafE family protein [Treponema sp.]|nr:sulfite exporter TauE/SafE family protein [Treponema sp.]